MLTNENINICNLLLAFSETIDFAAPSLASHQQRTAFAAWEMARSAGLSLRRQEGVFVTGLFHDIGALTLEEKVELHDNHARELKPHCKQGWALFKANAWLAPYADMVLNHHTDFSEWQRPLSDPTVFDSQLLYLADYLERHIDRKRYILSQKDALLEMVDALSGREVAPGIVALFHNVARREEFWFDLVSPKLYWVMLRKNPFSTLDVNLDTIKLFSELISHLVDFKSPFTATHSVGVACSAKWVGNYLGLDGEYVEKLGIAANLHDLGKLCLSNSILEKPGPLTDEERSLMYEHCYLTYTMLKTISGLDEIADWAGHHHETIDGQGYPFKVKGEHLSLGARIIAVADRFTALAEDRPYRPGLSREAIAEVLQKDALDGKIDFVVAKAFLLNADEIMAATAVVQGAVRQDYLQNHGAKELRKGA